MTLDRLTELEQAAKERAEARLAESEEEAQEAEARAQAAEAEVLRLREALEKALDVAIWLSGLLCPRESEAWHTWESNMRPKLNEARAREVLFLTVPGENEDQLALEESVL